MAGFDNDVCYAKNINFDSLAAQHPGIITTAGQILIGTGDDGSIVGKPAIKQGILNGSAGISATYNAVTGNIDLAVGAVTPVSFVTDNGTAQVSGNQLNIFGAGGTATSAIGNQITITSAGSTAVQHVVLDTGTTPIAPTAGGTLTFNGGVVAAGTNPVRTDGTGPNTMKLEVQTSQAAPASDASKIGLSAFDNTKFNVDPNGFVTSLGTGLGSTITGDSGGALSPTGGNWNILGSGSITTSGAASNLTVQLQGLTNHALLVGAGTSTITKLPIGATNQVLLGNTGLDPIWGSVPNAALTNSSVTINSGNNITVTGGNPLALGGTASIAVTGTTNHSVQIGNASGSLSSVANGTNGQVLQANTLLDPTWSTAAYPSVATATGTILRADGTNYVNTTATYPATTTINQILYSSANNTITGLASANNGVLTTDATGIPVITPLTANGQIIIGSGAGAPSAATLTAGSGISIVNGPNSITISSSSGGLKTLTGNSGGAISPDISGNINTIGTNSADGIVVSGAGNTLTHKVFKWLSPSSNNWLPVVKGTSTAGTGTYISQHGVYARIGYMIFFTFDLEWSAHTGSGNIEIDGFPITFALANINYPYACYIQNIPVPAGTIDVFFNGVNNQKFGFIKATVNGGLPASVALPHSGHLACYGFYFSDL